MPAYFKYTMIFTYQSGINATNTTPIRLGGWSESYYALAYDTPTYSAFLTLIQKRLGICPLGTFVNKVRVQRVNPVGPSSLTKVSYNAPDTWVSDVPQMAIKVPFFIGTNTGQILREFRGVPDVQVTLGEYTPTAPYTTSVQNFLKELCNGTWLANRRDKSQTQYLLTSIDATGNVVTTVPTAGIANGSLVQIIRTVNPQTGRKFGYFATVGAFTDNQHFQIVGPKVKASGFGKVRLALPLTSAFANPQYSAIESVVRKVGRVFRSYSGRASKHQ